MYVYTRSGNFFVECNNIFPKKSYGLWRSDGRASMKDISPSVVKHIKRKVGKVNCTIQNQCDYSNFNEY